MKHYKAEDMKLPEMKFTFEGRDFLLRCNLCVLDAVTEACGGNITDMFSKNAVKGVLVWIAAMMNDFAEDQEWPDYKPYTARYLGRHFKGNDEFYAEIIHLVGDSLSIPSTIVLDDSEPTEDQEPEQVEK